jgi:hypothetical protein
MVRRGTPRLDAGSRAGSAAACARSHHHRLSTCAVPTRWCARFAAGQRQTSSHLLISHRRSCSHGCQAKGLGQPAETLGLDASGRLPRDGGLAMDGRPASALDRDNKAASAGNGITIGLTRPLIMCRHPRAEVCAWERLTAVIAGMAVRSLSEGPLAGSPSRRSCNKPARGIGKTLQLRPSGAVFLSLRCQKFLRRRMVNLQPSGVFLGVQDRLLQYGVSSLRLLPRVARGSFFLDASPTADRAVRRRQVAKPQLPKKITILSNDARYLLLHSLHWLAHEGVRLKAGHRVKRSIERRCIDMDRFARVPCYCGIGRSVTATNRPGRPRLGSSDLVDGPEEPGDHRHSQRNPGSFL